MSWGQIKHSINSNIGRPLNEHINSNDDRPLNEQGYGMRTHVLRSGGPEGETITESVLSVSGSGFLYDLVSLDNLTINQTGPFRVHIIADGETIVDYSSPANWGANTRPRLNIHRLEGYEIVISSLAAGQINNEGLFTPLAFDENLQIILTKQMAQASPMVLKLQARLWIHTSTKVQTHERSANFRRLIFDTNTSFSIPANIRENEITLWAVGAGGTGSSNSAGQPGQPGQVRHERLDMPENRDVQITIGQPGANMSVGDTIISFNGLPAIIAQRGANGANSSGGTSNVGGQALPVDIFAGRGRGGNRTWWTGTENIWATPGQPGRVVIEYELV